MSQKIYLTILKSGIFLVFLSFFLLFKSLLFPFITSKQIYFNILIEILFIFWLSFITKYPNWRPKKSWITTSLISFFSVILLSCFFSVDFNLSFWGDVERMLGFFHLIHFLIFYLIIITVFKGWKDWKYLLIISIVAAVLVSFYGLLKNIHFSTIGNTAYVSGLMIFNVFFALLLFFYELYQKENKNNYLAGFYIVAIIIMIAIFRLTHTRGAYVGLGVGFAVMTLLYVFLSKSKKVRLYSLSVLIVLSTLVGLIFLYPSSNIVNNSSILRTITQINLETNTFQTRLIAWEAALKDLPNHLLLGTGHGNFAITFDKYFEPEFYNYTRMETYFDRAHNNIVDIASTTGILGLITYLSIMFFAFYYLITGYRKKKFTQFTFIVFFSLLVAYFIQNLAVFDSLVTYISLMITLGFIYWLTSDKGLPEKAEDKEVIKHTSDRGFDNKEIFTITITGLIIFVIMFQYNIRVLQMLKETIDGQYAFAKQDYVEGVEIYKKALSHNTPLDRDSRSSLVRSIIPAILSLEKLDYKQAQEILDYTIEQAKKNIELNPRDSLMLLELAQLYNITARFNLGNSDKFYDYSDLALKTIDRSIEASPKRVPLYYYKAQILATRYDYKKNNNEAGIEEEMNKALETLHHAASLNEDYYDSWCNLAKYYFYFQDQEQGIPMMNNCLDKGGVELINGEDYLKNLITYYVNENDWTRAMILYSQLIKSKPNDAQAWVHYATILGELGYIEEAIKAAEKSAEIDPSLTDASKAFINELEEKRNTTE